MSDDMAPKNNGKRAATFEHQVLSLPAELRKRIWDHLLSTTHKPTLATLIRCSRILHEDLTPALYRTLQMTQGNVHRICYGLGDAAEHLGGGTFNLVEHLKFSDVNTLQTFISLIEVYVGYFHPMPPLNLRQITFNFTLIPVLAEDRPHQPPITEEIPVMDNDGYVMKVTAIRVETFEGLYTYMMVYMYYDRIDRICVNFAGGSAHTGIAGYILGQQHQIARYITGEDDIPVQPSFTLRGIDILAPIQTVFARNIRYIFSKGCDKTHQIEQIKTYLFAMKGIARGVIDDERYTEFYNVPISQEEANQLIAEIFEGDTEELRGFVCIHTAGEGGWD